MPPRKIFCTPSQNLDCFEPPAEPAADEVSADVA
jgi:hypothetical protein